MKSEAHPSSIRIGTSNWSQAAIRQTLPKERLPALGMLRAYANVFDTVEINSTFYRFHRAETFAGWTAAVPSGFLFAIKANRLFTHERTLEFPTQELDDFLISLRSFGEKLGPILFQFPASFRADFSILQRFAKNLEAARKRARLRARMTLELRHESWHTARTFKILEQHQLGFCIFDIRKVVSPLVATSDLVYLRLHGPGAVPYQGRYGRPALQVWAKHLGKLATPKRETFVFFDNTQFDDAVPDALELGELLDQPRSLRTGNANCTEAMAASP